MSSEGKGKRSPRDETDRAPTPRQGEFLAFIRDYTRINREAPSEMEMAIYFQVTPPAAHGMIVTLEKRGFIERTPRQARSIRLLIDSNSLPSAEVSVSPPPPRSFADRYPNLAFWVAERGWIEFGRHPDTDSFARVMDEGGLIWAGGSSNETMEALLRAMEDGLKAFREMHGMGRVTNRASPP